MNSFQLVADQSEQGKRLSVFLRHHYPLAPVWVIKKAFKDKDIKVNGIRVAEDIKLTSGDQIIWYSIWKVPEIPVIFEDGNILIVNKPAGISTDQQADGAMCIESWALAREALVVHRLDQQTSGLLILSKNDSTKILLQDALKKDFITKYYQCLVYGIPSLKHAVLQAYLIKDAKRSQVSVSNINKEFAKEIITEYHLLETKGDYSRLLVTLHTGRTHQIRAHLAFCGYPILGDDKYGSRELNRKFKFKYLMLSSTSLEFHTKDELAYLDGKKFEILPPF